MRKKEILILSIFFLIMNVNIYSKTNEKETLSIEKLFLKLDEDTESYEIKMFEHSKRKIKNSIRENKMGDFNGINFSSNFNMYENHFDRREKKYSKNMQNKISYGAFYLNFNYNENKNNYISYGVEKNLKDLIYSQHKSNLKINFLNEDLNTLNLKKDLNNKKINFLNLYRDLIDTQNELKYRIKSQEYYKIELSKMKKMHDLGMEAKINLEALEIELEDVNLKLETLNTKLLNLYEIIKNTYNLELDKYILANIDIPSNFSAEEYIKNYLNIELDEIKINLNILKEQEKYLKYDTFMPDLIFSFERIAKNNIDNRVERGQNIFSLRFSKKLFGNNREYKNSTIEKEKLIDELKKRENDIKNEKLNLKLELENLEKSLQISEKKLAISLKKYEIKKKKYELKHLSYLDLIDEYNKYLNQEIETLKLKNALAVFVRQLIIRGEKYWDYEKNN